MAETPPSYYVVVSAQGPGWDDSRPMREQDGWPEHAEFMNDLEDTAFVVLGGPLDVDPHRAMLVVAAEDADAVERRLAEDPWRKSGTLVTQSIERWTILLGGSEPLA